MTWSKAQRYCRENYTDLVTIESLDDIKMLSRIAPASSGTTKIWIGLTRHNAKNPWMWSSGDTPGLVDYTNWASLPTSQKCGAVRVDGKWLSEGCNTALPFVCQTGECHISLIPIRNQ